MEAGIFLSIKIIGQPFIVPSVRDLPKIDASHLVCPVFFFIIHSIPDRDGDHVNRSALSLLGLSSRIGPGESDADDNHNDGQRQKIQRHRHQ